MVGGDAMSPIPDHLLSDDGYELEVFRCPECSALVPWGLENHQRWHERINMRLRGVAGEES